MIKTMSKMALKNNGKRLCLAWLGWGMLAGVGLSAGAQTMTLNVTNFGAKGDAMKVYVTTTSNFVTIDFTNSLTTNDVGKAVQLFGVGKQVIGNNVNGVWTTNYQDLIAVITNVIGNTAYISNDIPQQTASNVFCIYGTDNSSNFQAAVDAASGAHTIIDIPQGDYMLLAPCQYTNFAPNPNFFVYADQGITITKGGLHFKGAGRGKTVLLSQGAWKNQTGTWSYPYAPKNMLSNSVCLRGILFNVVAPIANDYPLIFESLTFDGGVQGLVGYQGVQPANPVDGLGWDGTSAAGVDSGSGKLLSLKVFNDCEFRHFRGEMIKGITGSAGDARTIVTNCLFWDGNATAFNYNTAHVITDCVFSNLYQVSEFYLKYPTKDPSYFINNYCTNIDHNFISLNGGTLTNQPYIISNNTFYCSMDGNAVATCPAANVLVASNLFVQWPGKCTLAIVIGQAGAQPGSPDAFNTNYIICGNIFSNNFYACVSAGGDGPQAGNRAEGIQIYNNSVLSTNGTRFLFNYGWTKNIHVFSNYFSPTLGTGVVFQSGKLGGECALVECVLADSNSLYPPWRQYYPESSTNLYSYGSGPLYYCDYVADKAVIVLDDANPAGIPDGAFIKVDNRANRWKAFNPNETGNVTVWPSSSRNAAPVVVPLKKEVIFTWSGGAWISRPDPPTHLHLPIN